MDVAANDVEAQLGNRKGRFWSDVGGVLGTAVAILWSDGRRRRVGGSDSRCAGKQTGQTVASGFRGGEGGCRAVLQTKAQRAAATA
jgi:hypothetical protein